MKFIIGATLLIIPILIALCFLAIYLLGERWLTMDDFLQDVKETIIGAIIVVCLTTWIGGCMWGLGMLEPIQ